MMNSTPGTLTALSSGRTFETNPSGKQYRTVMPADWMLSTGQVGASTVARSGTWAAFTGSTRDGRTVMMQHRISRSGLGLTINRQQLKAMYDPRHGECSLSFTHGGVDMVARVKPLRLLPFDGPTTNLAMGEWLLLSDEYYGASTPVVEVAKSSSPATLAWSNPGNVDSRFAQITLKPTAAKAAASGQRFLHPVLFINRAPRPLARHSLEVTGGGWNHAARVLATESMSTGRDVEVYVNQRRVPHWAGPGATGYNQSGTRLWVGVDAPAGRAWDHSGSATIGSGDTEVDVSTDLSAMPALPFFAAFYDAGSHEQVLVTGYERRPGGGGALTIERAQRGTAASSHAAGTQLWWTPVLIEVVYGWTSAPAPVWIDDRFKPVPAESASSGNDAWTFAEFRETENGLPMPRPNSWAARWRPRNRNGEWGDREDMYTDWVAYGGVIGSDANPASSMSIGYHKTPEPGHPPRDRWELYVPIGVSGVAFTETTATMVHPGAPNEGRLDVRAAAEDGAEVVLASYDGDTSTARSLTPAVSVLTIAFCIDPFDPTDLEDNTTGSSTVVAQEPSDDDGFRIHTGLVLTFDTGQTVLVQMNSQQSAYQIGRPDDPATMADEWGNTLSIRGPVVALNTVLTFDIEAETVTDADGLSYGHLVTGTWPVVPANPSSMPYSSDLTFTEAGIGTVGVAMPEVRGAWN